MERAQERHDPRPRGSRLKVSDYDFDLPAECIAQTPAEPRDAARLLVHELGRSSTRHGQVADLAQLLAPGDLLVLNDVRVRPARLFGRRASGGAVELLLLEAVAQVEAQAPVWRAMVKPARKLRPGEEIDVADGRLVARALERERSPEGQGTPFWTLELGAGPAAGEGGAADLAELLEQAGRMPLPPYIQRDPTGDARDALDRERYQTIFAQEPGAVAAPTAGLHFTHELLERIASRGIETARLHLDVGVGTFLPVQVEDAREHRMHAEKYVVPAETVSAVDAARARGGRIVAVGTTSVRALEAASVSGRLVPGAGETRLFITPGYEFHVVDALITNFHLPRSTLLMLVSALTGRERLLSLYADAIQAGYRFYSYGDAMLVLP